MYATERTDANGRVHSKKKKSLMIRSSEVNPPDTNISAWTAEVVPDSVGVQVPPRVGASRHIENGSLAVRFWIGVNNHFFAAEGELLFLRGVVSRIRAVGREPAQTL